MTEYKYEDLSELIDEINEERCISSEEVHPDLLGEKVWFYHSGLPGCMSNSYGVAETEEGAVESALYLCETHHGEPAEGAAEALRENHFFRNDDGTIVEISHRFISDCL